ncbi:hypothetical protein HZS_7222 [Henneguya salminicola]|nr:hypothetical protein HZS_7222 [Henneguya salminicola]
METWMKKYPKELWNYSKHNERIISRTNNNNMGILWEIFNLSKIPSVIHNGALQQTSTAVHAKMPNKDAIRKDIQRRRNEN